jgi:hypothetical protein
MIADIAYAIGIISLVYDWKKRMWAPISNTIRNAPIKRACIHDREKIKNSLGLTPLVFRNVLFIFSSKGCRIKLTMPAMEVVKLRNY